MYQHPPLPPGGSVFQHGIASSFDAFAFCDGTVKKGRGAFGFVLLDDHGVEASTGWSPLTESTNDSTTAEFFGLVETLRQAVQTGVKRLWVGTDSYQVVEHLNKRSSRYQRFIELVEQLVRSFDFLELQAIERSCNKRADALARQGVAFVR